MLSTIASTTHLDDVFREDPTTTSLESYIADLTGHEAGLLVLSGTMGNQLSIRTHLSQPPHSVLADARSHIIGWSARPPPLSRSIPKPITRTGKQAASPPYPAPWLSPPTRATIIISPSPTYESAPSHPLISMLAPRV